MTAAATIFAGVQMLLAAERETKAPYPGMVTATPAKLSPIPVPDSLAQPRSLKQFGIPDLQTLAEIPPYNPQTSEKLFFEPRLSADQTVACASCHNPDRAFTDGRPTSVGFKGRVGQRNASTILNVLYDKRQFWDGRAETLENQAAHCNRCHASVNQDATYFTDFDFHNIGIGFLSHDVTSLALRAMREFEKGHLRNVDRAISSDLSVLGRT